MRCDWLVPLFILLVAVSWPLAFVLARGRNVRRCGASDRTGHRIIKAPRKYVPIVHWR